MGKDSVFAVASLANLAAGYNLAVSGHVLLLAQSSGEEEVDEAQASAVASAALLGAVAGQLFFGWLGERLGAIPGLALAFLVISAGCGIGGLMCWPPGAMIKLAISRLLVGFGAGGVYPLAAVASAESSKNGFSGQRVILTFSFQGVGQLLAPSWVLLLDLLLPTARGISWRIAVLSGAIPAAYAIGFIPDVLREKEQRERMRLDNETEGDEPKPNTGMSFSERCSRKNLVLLIGTGGSWFLFDVMFYGNIIFTPFVVEMVFDAQETEVAALSTLIGLVALPGLYLASFLSDSLGRKRIQMIGFTSAGILFFILFAMLSSDVHSPVFIFLLYSLTFFFYNFGPNATTFCLPAEVFPNEVRSFFHGISAALGKLGAVVGASFFKFVLDQTSLGFVMLSSFVISILAIVVTFFFVPGSAVRADPVPLDDFGDVEIELGSRSQPGEDDSANWTTQSSTQNIVSI